MDPLTQGVLGASLAQAASKRNHMIMAGLLGMAGGMAADLDVLIRSDSDPLLFLKYHRQFTHSLIFIPLGGLLCATFLYALLASRTRLGFFRYVLLCTLGYATHALLDSCTSYGTQLLWPFSNQRIAWNIMSIVDPLYTVPMAVLVVLATLKGKPGFARVALVWALLYPVLGLIQRERAEHAVVDMASQRHHQPTRLEVKPGFANLLLWRTVYETENHYHIDAVRAGTSVELIAGQRVEKLDIARDFPWLPANTQQRLDIERFRWFSNDYLAVSPDDPLLVMDVRYSMVPNEVRPLWGIELSPQAQPDQYVRYRTNRKANKQTRQRYFELLSGQ